MNTNEPSAQEHPRVHVDLDRQVLVVQGRHGPYEVDLARCDTPAELLDAILQVSLKPWCDRRLAGELLAAVETACRAEFARSAQAVYCLGGQPQRVAWK